MKTKRIGVVGYKGKLGSLLVRKPNFVPVDCDITDLPKLLMTRDRIGEVDLIVNCAAISSVAECEKRYWKALEVNAQGLLNLHKAFGERVLNLSSDQVFSGDSWLLPREGTDQKPINNYGLTKFGAEATSHVKGGKTIRLSRSISVMDLDISDYLWNLQHRKPISVPTFFYRNYIHRHFVVDGIEHFANHYDTMPEIVNYAGSENISMWDLVRQIGKQFGLDISLIEKNKQYDPVEPRPQRGGFSVALAKKLGFPMYSISDTVSRMEYEYLLQARGGE